MSRNTTLPVALVQEHNHGDADANLAVIELRVAEAARQGAKLVLLQEAFPDREIIAIPCRPLIWQNGSLHCITMQLPEGVLA